MEQASGSTPPRNEVPKIANVERKKTRATAQEVFGAPPQSNPILPHVIVVVVVEQRAILSLLLLLLLVVEVVLIVSTAI